MKKPGWKSSESWVVATFIADLFFKRFGVYEHFSPEQINDVAAQVGQIAAQLRGETGSDSIIIYLIGGLYVAGRTLLKWKEAK